MQRVINCSKIYFRFSQILFFFTLQKPVLNKHVVTVGGKLSPLTGWDVQQIYGWKDKEKNPEGLNQEYFLQNRKRNRKMIRPNILKGLEMESSKEKKRKVLKVIIILSTSLDSSNVTGSFSHGSYVLFPGQQKRRIHHHKIKIYKLCVRFSIVLMHVHQMGSCAPCLVLKTERIVYMLFVEMYNIWFISRIEMMISFGTGWAAKGSILMQNFHCSEDEL